MKKLSILSLAILASSIVPLQMESRSISKTMQEKANSMQVARAEIDSTKGEADTVEVLEDLAGIDPTVVERIVEEEAEGLENSFHSIHQFVQKKYKEVKKLLMNGVASQIDIARLAVELADAQSTLEKTIARQRAKNKPVHKLEKQISDLLVTAQQALRTLNSRAMEAIRPAVKRARKALQPYTRSRATRSAAHASSDMMPEMNDDMSAASEMSDLTAMSDLTDDME